MTTLSRDDPPGGPRDQDEQGEPPTVADLPPVGDQRGELVLAREIRAREMVAGRTAAQIAAVIRAECLPGFRTTWIRAHRLALGIALADVVAQVRARYAAEGRKAPRFSETLLSAYESGQKRPGPEYLHYLCAVRRCLRCRWWPVRWPGGGEDLGVLVAPGDDLGSSQPGHRTRRRALITGRRY